MRVSAPTEDRHPGTRGIDTLSTLEMLQLLNGEDAKVAPAVAEVLPALATLVDATVASLQAGGCVHYFGAGTSGRLAVLDAAELLPTFNAPEGLFTAHHAGDRRPSCGPSRTSRTTSRPVAPRPRACAPATSLSG